MNELIQPIDGSYFETVYFWVSLGISLVMALASVWNEKGYEDQ